MIIVGRKEDSNQKIWNSTCHEESEKASKPFAGTLVTKEARRQANKTQGI